MQIGAGVVQPVIEALGEIRDAPAVGPLIGLLQDDYDVRWRAVDALGHIRDEQAIEPLIEPLGHELNWVPPSKVIQALRRIADEGAAEAVVRVLRPEDRDPVRQESQIA